MNSGNKFIECLKALSKNERNRLQKFADSSFFNQHTLLKQFIKKSICWISKDDFYPDMPKEISSENPRADSSGITESTPSLLRKPDYSQYKKKMYKELFGSQPFDNLQLNDLFSMANKLMDEFLSQLLYEKDTLRSKLYLSEAYLDRNLSKHFKMEINQLRKSNSLLNNDQIFIKQYNLESLSDNHFIKQGIRKVDESIVKQAEHLDHFYILSKLKLFCEMLNRKNIIAKEFHLTFEKEIINFINSHPKDFLKYVLIKAYYYIFLTISDSDNEAHYNQLKLVLKNELIGIPATEAKPLFDYAENYCIKKINKGQQHYVTELLDLYKSLVKENLLLQNNTLSHLDYKNVVTIGLRGKDYTWTKKFIEQQKNKITTPYRENAYTYNLANFYYETKEYRSAIKLLQQVDFVDVSYGVGARSILLKIYYDMDEEEAFLSLIEAFKIYILRNKIMSSYQKKSQLNFITISKIVFKTKQQLMDNKKIDRVSRLNILRKKVEVKKNVANINWIKEKIGEL